MAFIGFLLNGAVTDDKTLGRRLKVSRGRPRRGKAREGASCPDWHPGPPLLLYACWGKGHLQASFVGVLPVSGGQITPQEE